MRTRQLPLAALALLLALAGVAGAGGTVITQPIGVTGATTGGGLVKTGTKLGLLTSCAPSEVLAWNGSAWACSAGGGGGGGGITNSAGANVVMKSDGTNAVASSITDSGTAISSTEGVTFGAVATVNANTLKGTTTLWGDLVTERPLALTNSTNARVYAFQTGDAGANGGVNSMTFRYVTGGVRVWDADTSGNLYAINNYTVGGTSSLNGNVSVGGVLDVNNALAKFGSAADGQVYISANTINWGYDLNASGTSYLNYYGYNAGTTQFRDLVIADGKSATACTLTASTKTLNCVGGLQVNGSNVALGSSISGTSGRSARLATASTVGTGAFVDNGTNASIAGTFTATANNAFGDATTDTNTFIGSVSITAPTTSGFTFAAASTSTTQGNHEAFLRVKNSDTTTGNYEGIVFGSTARAAIEAKNVNIASNYADLAITTRSAGGYSARDYTTSAGQKFFGDTTNTSIDNNLTAVTIGQTGTGLASTSEQLLVADTGTYVGGTTATYSYGSHISRNTSCSDCTVANLKGHASIALGVDSTGDITGDNAVYPISLYTRYGDNYFNVDGTTSSYFGGATFVDSAYANNVYASSIHPLGSAVVGGGGPDFSAITGSAGTAGGAGTGTALYVDSSLGGGTLYLETQVANGAVAIGGYPNTAITASNSIKGATLNYDGIYGELNEEFTFRNAVATSINNGWWSCTTTGTGASCGLSDNATISGRIGVQRWETGTTATGRSGMATSTAAISPADGTYVNHTVWRVPTLSNSTDGMAFQTGLMNGVTSIAQSNGCMLTYDERNVLGANASNTHNLVASCCKGGTCQHRLLDGTTVCDGSFTSIATTISAGSWIETEVRMSSSAVEFWADTGSGLTERCQITNSANIPTVNVGWINQIIKSVGTTSLNVQYDFAQLRWTLNSARSP